MINTCSTYPYIWFIRWSLLKIKRQFNFYSSLGDYSYKKNILTSGSISDLRYTLNRSPKRLMFQIFFLFLNFFDFPRHGNRVLIQLEKKKKKIDFLVLILGWATFERLILMACQPF